MAFLLATRQILEKWHPVIIVEIQDDRTRISVKRLGGQQMIKPIGGRDDVLQFPRNLDYRVDPLANRFGEATSDYLAVWY